MELQRNKVKEYGFDNPIDCGAVTMYLFDSQYLRKNTTSKSDMPITLAEQRFSEAELPDVTHSGLEIIPASPLRDLELTGFINFDLPWALYDRENTDAKILKKLRAHLDSTIHFRGYYMEIENKTLVINSYTQAPVTIRLTNEDGDHAYFEVSAPLNSNTEASNLYEAIGFGVAAWGQVHDFIARAEDPRRHSRNNILVGVTDKMEVSDIEYSIEARLARLALEQPDATLPQWGDDIISEDLIRLGRHMLSEDEVEILASDLVRHKRDLYGVTGDMSPISQGDIVQTMSQLLARRRR
jgi:hypothetical protein